VGGKIAAGPKRATIASVAKKVGVSNAAVSYAFNGQPGISAELRAKILATAEELGWRPSRIARQLRDGTSDVMGLLLADIANPGYAELAGGVIAEAADRGYQVFVSHVGVDGEQQQEASMAHVDRRSAGLIFTSLVEADRPLLEKLERWGIPFVQLYRSLDGVEADWVGIDDVEAGRELGAHVAELGRRQVAILGGPEQGNTSRNRVRGFVEGLTAGGAEIVNLSDMHGSITRASGAARAAHLLDRHPRLDALVCGNDVIAFGALDACHERGLDVPSTVAVTGFDDLGFGSIGPLQLTTVTIPLNLFGRRAVAMLAARIEGNGGPSQQETLQHELQIRQTTVGSAPASRA